MLTEYERHDGADHFLFTPAVTESFTPELFVADYLEVHDLLLDKNTLGRGQAWAFCWQGEDFILRHFRRGGLVAKLSQTSYFWTGLEQTRAWQEWRLLAKMYGEGLPCPKPFAAHVHRKGCLYQASLITHRIPNTSTVAERYLARLLDDSDWSRAGETIRQFHDRQIYHADLNANNILIDTSGRIFLIDFDKGTVKQGEDWKQKNLSRLHRSFEKISRKSGDISFLPAQWDLLLAAYYADSREE